MNPYLCPNLHPIDPDPEPEDFTPTAAELAEAATEPRFAGWHPDDIASEIEYERREEHAKSSAPDFDRDDFERWD